MKLLPKVLVLPTLLLFSFASVNVSATADSNLKTIKSDKKLNTRKIGICDGVPEWNATTAYIGGTSVKYQGKLYSAKYWNQNANPAAHATDPSGAWKYVADC